MCTTPQTAYAMPPVSCARPVSTTARRRPIVAIEPLSL